MHGLVLIHAVTAIALVVLAAVAAIWGGWRSRAGTSAPSTRERAAWGQLSALWQTLVAACGLAGLGLLARRHWHAHGMDPLHLRVYGPFMVVAILGAYSFRTSDGRWNMRVMAVAAGFVTLLGVRALWTGY